MLPRSVPDNFITGSEEIARFQLLRTQTKRRRKVVS
jgi:hypothetical protein